MIQDLTYLKEAAPDLLKLLTSGELRDERFSKIERISTRQGEPNLRIHTQQGEMTLHSNYSPQREGEKLLAKSAYDKRCFTIIFGLGLGYHIDALIEQHPDAELIIVEPCYKILETAVQVRDFSPYFKNSRFKILISSNPEEVAKYLCELYNFYRYAGVEVLELPSYLSLFQTEWEAIKSRFMQAISKYTINSITIMESEGDFTQNCMKNVRYFNSFPWARHLFSKFQGIPAIIISAGPSLQLQFEKLRSLQEQAVLICVDTAYPILKGEGISPHLICTADPTPGNFIHLKNMEVADTYVVVEPMSYHEILEMQGLQAFITTFNGYYSKYFAEFASGPESLISWGSIASTCFDLARNMGCGPIIFVGQDFAHSDFLYHCPGSNFDAGYTDTLEDIPNFHLFKSLQTFHIQRILEYKLYPEPDVNGETVYCQKNMRLYAKWFHDEFRKTSSVVINASERGILKEYCHQMKFQQVIDQVLVKTYPIRETLHQLYTDNRDFNHARLLEDIDSKLSELTVAADTAEALQTNCMDLLGHKNDADDPEGKEIIRDLFNRLAQQSECGITDRYILDWIDHENQKAEMFFKREIGKMVGQRMTPELIETTANHYFNFLESRKMCFGKIADYMNMARGSCQENLEIGGLGLRT
jgi:hypothetical protein